MSSTAIIALRRLIVIIAALCFAHMVQADDKVLFPQPAELEADVRFWVRVYTEVDTDAGFIHDSRNLGIVYEVVRFSASSSKRARSRHVKRLKQRYRRTLLTLASGKRRGLSKEQKRVLALWPKNISNRRLKAAARNLRFQLGQANRFRAGLIRSGAWVKEIERVLDRKGVPRALAALPHVESSFNPKAYSHAGAAGLWQFTRATGRRYLRIDNVVDERLDPYKSTVAAARLLKDNYAITGTWPLALTAYNHGAAGVRRAVRKLGTRNIATIARKYKSRSFGFASRNFYVAFLAAVHVQSHAQKYFGAFTRHTPPQLETVSMPSYLSAQSVARTLGVSLSTLKTHNLALRPAVWNGSKYIPAGYELLVPRRLLASDARQNLLRVASSEGHESQVRDRFYKVRRGNTLGQIASRFNVSTRQLAALNGLRNRNRIRVGQVLRLPSVEPKPLKVAATTAPAAASAQMPDDGRYRVRRGDTLSAIAKRFGLGERDLMSHNGIRNRHRIRIGQILSLRAEPIEAAPEASPTAKAELEVATVHPAPEPKASENGANPGVSQAEEAKTESTQGADEIETSFAASASPVSAADPSDYNVASDGTIEVQAAETLGHYSHWLSIRAKQLRRANRMRFGDALVIGRRLKLDFSRVDQAEFERKRLAHHRALQEKYFAKYQITDSVTHELKRDETLWILAHQKYRVPIWLLRQYNPDVDFDVLRPGMRVNIPVVQYRAEAPPPNANAPNPDSRPS